MTKKMFLKAVSFVTACVLFFMTPLSVGAFAGDDYWYKKYAFNEGHDEWGMAIRNCTSFAAWCLAKRNNFDIAKKGMYGAKLGNAKNWAKNAKRFGYRVDRNPAIGAIAFWNTGDHGHVAWVESVQGEKITIQEYNLNVDGRYTRRTISKWSPHSYIHFADISSQQVQGLDIGNHFYAYIMNHGNGRYMTKNAGDAMISSTTSFEGDRSIWYFYKVRGNWYRIQNLSDGRSLDVPMAKAEASKRLQVSIPYTEENEAQMWAIYRGRGNAYLQSKLSNTLTLDAHQQEHYIYLWNHHGVEPQTFSINQITNPNIEITYVPSAGDYLELKLSNLIPGLHYNISVYGTESIETQIVAESTEQNARIKVEEAGDYFVRVESQIGSLRLCSNEMFFETFD